MELAPMKVWTSITMVGLSLYTWGGDGFAQRREKPKRDATKTKTVSKKPADSAQLISAACGGRLGEVVTLFAAGADPNVGEITRHAVPFTPLGCAVRAKNIRMVDVLIAAGGEMNPTDNFPPLLFALEPGGEEVIDELIARGADVNLKFHVQGITFLMLAAGSGPPKVVRTLLDAGADVNARDNEGRTALTYAEQFNERSEDERGEVISLLKRARAKE